jgi:hypothetical protein
VDGRNIGRGLVRFPRLMRFAKCSRIRRCVHRAVPCRLWVRLLFFNQEDPTSADGGAVSWWAMDCVHEYASQAYSRLWLLFLSATKVPFSERGC